MYDASRPRSILFECENDVSFTYEEYARRGY